MAAFTRRLSPGVWEKFDQQMIIIILTYDRRPLPKVELAQPLSNKNSSELPGLVQGGL